MSQIAELSEEIFMIQVRLKSSLQSVEVYEKGGFGNAVCHKVRQFAKFACRRMYLFIIFRF